jgi:hypothetical protein
MCIFVITNKPITTMNNDEKKKRTGKADGKGGVLINRDY